MTARPWSRDLLRFAVSHEKSLVSTVQPGIVDPHESFKGLTLEDVFYLQGNDDFSKLLAESVDNEPFDGWFTSDDVPFHHQRDDVR